MLTLSTRKVTVNDFYNRLDLLRKRKGESIVDIARFLGISGPAVHGWKKGGLPGADKLHLLAEHYKVSVDWLLTGSEDAATKNPPTNSADGSACLYPEVSELESLSNRMVVMEGQLDTVIRLLGSALRVESSNPDTTQNQSKTG